MLKMLKKSILHSKSRLFCLSTSRDSMIWMTTFLEINYDGVCFLQYCVCFNFPCAFMARGPRSHVMKQRGSRDADVTLTVCRLVVGSLGPVVRPTNCRLEELPWNLVQVFLSSSGGLAITLVAFNLAPSASSHFNSSNTLVYDQNLQN